MIDYKLKKITIVVFLTLLITPIIIEFSGVENLILEKKEIAIKTFPEFNVKKPAKTIKNYKKHFSSNFGLKLSLVEVYKSWTENVFNDNPLPNKVITGKEGWLFLGNSENKAVSQSLGFTSFTIKELNQIAINVQKQREWLEHREIQYFIAVTPSKHSVYRPYLPFNAKYKPTKFDVLKEYLKKEIDFELIDLKEYYQLTTSYIYFYKHDTHWTDYGAYFGYEKLIDEIQKTNQILKHQRVELNDFKELPAKNKLGDLNKLLNNNSVKEEVTELTKKGETQIIELEKELIVPKNYSFDSEMYENRFLNKKNKLKILIFRDSFSIALKKYLNETFGESVYIWKHKFDKELIEKEKPDIVLYQLGERVVERLMEK